MTGGSSGAPRTAPPVDLPLFVYQAREFEGVDAEFLRARTIHYVRQRSGEVLVSIIDEGLPLPSPDSLWALMSAMQRATTIDPPNGILSSAIAAGTLALIADDSLPTLLDGWPGRITDHTKTEGNVRDYIHTVFLGWFAENGAYPALSGPSSEWRAGVTALVRHQTYRGHLWYLLNASGRVLNENAQMRDEASTIQGLLQESLR